MSFLSYLILAALLGLATTVSAVPIEWQPCVGYENAADQCTIHQVDAAPCTETTSQGVCRLPIGRSVTFSFDFTPNFSGGDLQTSIRWKHWYQYLPMDESWDDLNPCTSTACPVTAGQRQSYSRTFTLSAGSFPTTYTLESNLWNSENKHCCFTFTINLAR